MESKIIPRLSARLAENADQAKTHLAKCARQLAEATTIEQAAYFLSAFQDWERIIAKQALELAALVRVEQVLETKSTGGVGDEK